MALTWTALSELHILFISRSLATSMLMNLVDSVFSSCCKQDMDVTGHFFLCERSFTFCDSTYSYGCSFCSSFSRQPLTDRILRLGPESTFFLYTLPLVHSLMPLPFSTSVCEWMPQFLSPMWTIILSYQTLIESS